MLSLGLHRDVNKTMKSAAARTLLAPSFLRLLLHPPPPSPKGKHQLCLPAFQGSNPLDPSEPPHFPQELLFSLDGTLQTNDFSESANENLGCIHSSTGSGLFICDESTADPREEPGLPSTSSGEPAELTKAIPQAPICLKVAHV